MYLVSSSSFHFQLKQRTKGAILSPGAIIGSVEQCKCSVSLPYESNSSKNAKTPLETFSHYPILRLSTDIVFDDPVSVNISITQHLQ